MKLFADGADKAGMLESMYHGPLIQGFTAKSYAHAEGRTSSIIKLCTRYLACHTGPSYFFRGLFRRFRRNGTTRHTRSRNGVRIMHVKIPVTNTWESSVDLARSLAQAGVKLNVTAVMTLDQVASVSARVLADGPPAFVSGICRSRIADTGRDPMPVMAAAVGTPAHVSKHRINLGQPARIAEYLASGQGSVGCHYYGDERMILAKPRLGWKEDLQIEYSLEDRQNGFAMTRFLAWRYAAAAPGKDNGSNPERWHVNPVMTSRQSPSRRW